MDEFVYVHLIGWWFKVSDFDWSVGSDSDWTMVQLDYLLVSY
jgi:hypothetical protein